MDTNFSGKLGVLFAQKTIFLAIFPTFHSGILGFNTLIPTKNENILVFEKSKWIRKQKLTSNIGFFL